MTEIQHSTQPSNFSVAAQGRHASEFDIASGQAAAVAGDFHADILAIKRIEAVPRILEVICRTTGMGFAAIARVTESRWVCCAVRDEIKFGLQPGDELKLETTICNEIRRDREAVGIRRRCTASRATSRFLSSDPTERSLERFARSIPDRRG